MSTLFFHELFHPIYYFCGENSDKNMKLNLNTLLEISLQMSIITATVK